MNLRIIKNYESDFTLAPEAQANLFELLNNTNFVEQIREQTQSEKIKFTGLLFQPIPYSQATPKGMPPEFEAYHHSPNHIIINVPPNFMFKAKIFKPSRLCAIYEK
jgi:hypothetical protein